jgi:hypothetical protein
MRHARRRDETPKLFDLIHLDFDDEFATGRDVHGPADLGRVIDWHRGAS